MVSLKDKTSVGILWSSVEQFSVQGIQFIMGLIIARLVMPSEYGLIVMLGIFLAISNTFIDSGFSKALIQKQDRTQTDLSTVFYYSVAVALILYAALYFCAPLIARFYEQPRLVDITRVVGLTLIINSLGSIQRAKFAIDMNFKSTAKASLLSATLSGLVGVVMAYKGYEVWALVAQSLTGAVLVNLFLWLMSKWHPSWEYSWTSFRQLFSFGSKLLLSGLMHTIYINLYSLVIGKRYNAADVGFYNRASSLAQYPSVNIMALLNKVLYPAQCQIQDDAQKLASSFTQYLKMACFLIFPLMLMLSALAYPLVGLVLTEKWLPSAPFLQVLCLAYMWSPVMIVNNNILNVKGRSDYFLRAEIIKKISAVAILIATLPFGVMWLCIGIVAYNILDMTIIIFYSKKVVDTGYLRQLKEVAPTAAASFIMGLCAWGTTHLFESYWAQIGCGLLAGGAVFVILVKLLRINELNVIFTLLRSVLKNNGRNAGV